MTENPKVRLQFAPGQPASLSIGQGEINGVRYARTFHAQDQPFECDAEEALMLLGTGSFVKAVAATDDDRQQTDDQAAESEPLAVADAPSADSSSKSAAAPKARSQQKQVKETNAGSNP